MDNGTHENYDQIIQALKKLILSHNLGIKLTKIEKSIGKLNVIKNMTFWVKKKIENHSVVG